MVGSTAISSVHPHPHSLFFPPVSSLQPSLPRDALAHWHSVLCSSPFREYFLLFRPPGEFNWLLYLRPKHIISLSPPFSGFHSTYWHLLLYCRALGQSAIVRAALDCSVSACERISAEHGPCLSARNFWWLMNVLLWLSTFMERIYVALSDNYTHENKDSRFLAFPILAKEKDHDLKSVNWKMFSNEGKSWCQLSFTELTLCARYNSVHLRS